MLLKIIIYTNVGGAINETFAEKAKRNWFDVQIHIFLSILYYCQPSYHHIH